MNVGSAERKQAGPTNTIIHPMSNIFKQHPAAKRVYTVGDNVFLECHVGAANEYAKRLGLDCIEVVNPKLEAVDSEEVLETDLDELFDELDQLAKAAGAVPVEETEETIEELEEPIEEPIEELEEPIEKIEAPKKKKGK